MDTALRVVETMMNGRDDCGSEETMTRVWNLYEMHRVYASLEAKRHRQIKVIVHISQQCDH